MEGHGNLMFLSIVSGSSGNSSLISVNGTTLLIDCGMSGKKLEEALASRDISCSDIDAILVTHEHIDHTKGVGIISRRYNIPIYASEGTFASADFGKISDDNIHIISADSDFEIGKIGISPFTISHDAKEPLGFSFDADEKKLTVATDSGVITEGMWRHMMGSDEIILESNHDVDLLMYGSYPMNLKRRILGEKGHLSNDTTAKVATWLLKSGTKKIMLGHLSNENNTPEIAYQTTKNALTACGAIIGKDISLSVANRYEITDF